MVLEKWVIENAEDNDKTLLHKVFLNREATLKQMQLDDRRREREAENKSTPKEMYRASHWFCSPRCGFNCRREDEGQIQQHQEQCYWYRERVQRERELAESRLSGYEKMRYIISAITRSKEDIAMFKRKIAKERANKQPNWEQVIEHYQNEIEQAKRVIKSELVQRDKLLSSSDNPNEIEREAAQELYDEYLRTGKWR